MQFSVGANVIIVRDGNILLGLRRNFGVNTWGLPGGHAEPQESFEHAALRELQEETGMLVARLSFSSIVDQPDRDAHYVQVTFVGESPAGEPQLLEPHECYEWGWFPLHALPENLFFPHVTPIELFRRGGNFSTDTRH